MVKNMKDFNFDNDTPWTLVAEDDMSYGAPRYGYNDAQREDISVEEIEAAWRDVALMDLLEEEIGFQDNIY